MGGRPGGRPGNTQLGGWEAREHTAGWKGGQGTHSWVGGRPGNTQLGGREAREHTAGWVGDQGTHSWVEGRPGNTQLGGRPGNTQLGGREAREHTAGWKGGQGTHSWVEGRPGNTLLVMTNPCSFSTQEYDIHLAHTLQMDHLVLCIVYIFMSLIQYGIESARLSSLYMYVPYPSSPQTLARCTYIMTSSFCSFWLYVFLQNALPERMKILLQLVLHFVLASCVCVTHSLYHTLYAH